ncbi:hypothetical protein V8E53_014083 [Lactarius tabidus]
MCAFGGVQDDGCGRQHGPKRARMPPAGGEGEGEGEGEGAESSWRREPAKKMRSRGKRVRSSRAGVGGPLSDTYQDPVSPRTKNGSKIHDGRTVRGDECHRGPAPSVTAGIDVCRTYLSELSSRLSGPESTGNELCTGTTALRHSVREVLQGGAVRFGDVLRMEEGFVDELVVLFAFLADGC